MVDIGNPHDFFLATLFQPHNHREKGGMLGCGQQGLFNPCKETLKRGRVGHNKYLQPQGVYGVDD